MYLPHANVEPPSSRYNYGQRNRQFTAGAAFCLSLLISVVPSQPCLFHATFVLPSVNAFRLRCFMHQSSPCFNREKIKILNDAAANDDAKNLQGIRTTSTSLSLPPLSTEENLFNPYDDAEPPPPPLSPVSSSLYPPFIQNMTHRPLPKVKLVRRRLISACPSPYDAIPEDKEEEWEFFFELFCQFVKEEKKNSAKDTSKPSLQLDEIITKDHYNKKRMEKEIIPKQTRKRLILHEPSPGPLAHQSPLRNWIADQRKSYMKSLGILNLGTRSNWGTPYLSPIRKRRLDSVGFAWGHIERTDISDEILFSEEYQQMVEIKYKDWIWTPIYERLVAYKERTGHTRVPLRETSGLGTWTEFQRAIRYQMPSRRRQKLDEIEFDWQYLDPREDEAWLKGLFCGNEPNAVSPNQSIEVPSGNNAISNRTLDGTSFPGMEDLPIPVEEVIARTAIPRPLRWTQRLGKQNPSAFLQTPSTSVATSKAYSCPEHANRDPNMLKPISWSKRIQDLKAYIGKYGNSNVPIDFDEIEIASPGLGQWLKRTKTNKKLSWKSRLTLERLGVRLE